MSKCVVHMMKLKMSAMGGIQSHNQREHPSKKNKEIDYAKSEKNYDLALCDNINYQRAVKERIAELDLKKAVRKDAVVYCSFIVTSDKSFFEKLGERYHRASQADTNENIYWGLEEPTPFEYMPETYKASCIAKASEKYFLSAYNYFCERYGEENVINATVHMDEATPHMHLGLVPVTKDGRLSAKDIFTPIELKQLQTDFAEKVGKKLGLERGKEGSETKHLDEVSYKLKQREEQAKKLSVAINKLEIQQNNLKTACKDLDRQRESLNKTILGLDRYKTTLERDITVLEGKLDGLEADKKTVMLKFIELPQIKPIFNDFFRRVLESLSQRKKDRAEHSWKDMVEKEVHTSEAVKRMTGQANNRKQNLDRER